MKMTTPIKILLADNQILMRKGLKHLCQNTHQHMVTFDAHVDEHLHKQVGHTKPDVIVMSLTHSRTQEVKILQQVRKRLPHVPILLLIESEELLELDLAIRAGIRGYLPKTADTKALFKAINAISLGNYLIDPQVAIRALSLEMGGGSQLAKDRLTKHEMEVLRLVAYGIK